MTNNREILEFYLIDIFSDYFKRTASEYFELPEMSEILSYLKSSLNDHSVLIVSRSKRRMFNKISDLATHPLESLTERKENVAVLVKSLEKQLKDEDYLFLMALFTEDDKQSASCLKQALQKSPGKLHLQIASVFDKEAAGDFTTLLDNLKAIPVKPLTPVKINFFNIVHLLELIECRPHDCNAANLTGFFENVNLDHFMKYSIFYGLFPKLETETLYEVFCNLDFSKNDVYSFGKLLEGALYYRMKRYSDAILVLESVDIPSTIVSEEHKAEYQYYLEECYKNIGDEPTKQPGIMKISNKGTFLSLNPKAKIFEEIKIQQPQWWSLLCNDNELYVEIRKDNYINVYYYGGSLAKIGYLNGFVAKTHQKYLGNAIPRRKTKTGKDVFNYDLLNLVALDRAIISEIKNRIKSDYLQQINAEKPAEKWIQGKMVKRNPNYIDSEFQFNKDPEIGKLRIDLVELSNGLLSFVELKGIFDNRLRNDTNRNSKVPEIIEQMERYKLFINKYEEDIIDYYQKLIEIKNTLGLTTIDKTKIKLNKIPKLIIVDTYGKMTLKRNKRIGDIKHLLENHSIDYQITK